MIQIWYIAATDGHYNEIIIISLIFTVISILVSIMSMCVTRKISKEQTVIIIEFEVKGQIIVSNERNTNRAKKLKEQLGSILGINKDLIDLERPQKIPGGVKVRLNIQMNADQAGKHKLQELINKAMQNEQLSDTVKEAWKLTMKPNVKNLKCKEKDSKGNINEYASNSNGHSTNDALELTNIATNTPNGDSASDSDESILNINGLLVTPKTDIQ